MLWRPWAGLWSHRRRGWEGTAGDDSLPRHSRHLPVASVLGSAAPAGQSQGQGRPLNQLPLCRRGRTRCGWQQRRTPHGHGGWEELQGAAPSPSCGTAGPGLSAGGVLESMAFGSWVLRAPLKSRARRWWCTCSKSHLWAKRKHTLYIRPRITI